MGKTLELVALAGIVLVGAWYLSEHPTGNPSATPNTGSPSSPSTGTPSGFGVGTAVKQSAYDFCVTMAMTNGHSLDFAQSVCKGL